MTALPPPIQPPAFEYRTQFVNLRGGEFFVGGTVHLEPLNEALAMGAQQGWRLASSFVATNVGEAACQVVLIFERPKAG